MNLVCDDVVFLNRTSRLASNGKTYYNVNLLVGEDTLSIGCAEDTANGIQPFSHCTAVFGYREWQGVGRLSLVMISAVSSAKTSAR